jgi:hypothetical protein
MGLTEEDQEAIKGAYHDASAAISEFAALADDYDEAGIVEHMCEHLQEQLKDAATTILNYCPCCGEEAVPVDPINDNETETMEILPCIFEMDVEEGLIRFNMYGEEGALLEITGWEEMKLLETKEGGDKVFESGDAIVALLRAMADQLERKGKAARESVK